MAKNTIPMLGRVFDRLTVIAQSASIEQHGYWLCQCSCGNQKVIRGDSLTAGTCRSCGCINRARITEMGKASKTHGRSRTPEYVIWVGMIKRCENPRCRQFKYYGGRGIKVCDRWRQSFSAFLEDMGYRPPDKYAIERRDNDGPYAPENCFWSTRLDQMNNRRSNVNLTLDGQTLTVSQWARKLGVRPATLYQRLKYGWTTEEALTQSVRQRGHSD